MSVKRQLKDPEIDEPLKNPESGEIEIIPLKDFHIYFPPKFDIKLIKGEPVSVPLMFKQNLITENIIKEE